MDIKEEAVLLGNYLIGKKIDDPVIELYIKAMNIFDFELSEKEKKLWNKIEKHPFLISIIDSGLTLLDKNSILKKKIFIMFSILETIPDYSEKFLPRKFHFFYLFKLAFIGTRGIFRGVFGYIYLRLVYK